MIPRVCQDRGVFIACRDARKVSTDQELHLFRKEPLFGVLVAQFSVGVLAASVHKRFLVQGGHSRATGPTAPCPTRCRGFSTICKIFEIPCNIHRLYFKERFDIFVKISTINLMFRYPCPVCFTIM